MQPFLKYVFEFHQYEFRKLERKKFEFLKNKKLKRKKERKEQRERGEREIEAKILVPSLMYFWNEMKGSRFSEPKIDFSNRFSFRQLCNNQLSI